MPIQIILGAIAGVTIFLGLPIAMMPTVNERTRSFLTAISTGILIFLLVEIMGKQMELIEELFQSASEGYPQLGNAFLFSGLLLGGLAAGLLGMIYFEERFIRSGKDEAVPGVKATQLALMIAIGIGVHNLTEGLAIAQAYGWGEERLALVLALGFALHNATEGFGIAGPLAGQKPSWKFLALAGLIGGGPTFLGTILGTALGEFSQSNHVRVFCLSLAGGTLLYLVGELMHLGRHLKGEAIVEVGLLVGFALGFATEMALVFSGFSL